MLLKLLIVDDEPIILKGLINIISKQDELYTNIVGATDGIDALEKSKDFQPDLVITDINMPEMSGLELIKKMKEERLCKRFIIVTGYDEFDYAREALRYQVMDYLLKPINKREITELVSRVVSEMRQQQESGKATQSMQADLTNTKEYSRKIKEVLQLIAKQYEQDMGLDTLAEYVQLHPNYLSALFKKETGYTFLQYFHMYRIAKAKQLLMEKTDLPIQQIAIQVGYENQEHFYKVFRKYAGQTPGNFRETFSE